MSLPKKISRTVVVDGLRYRWGALGMSHDTVTTLLIHRDRKKPGQHLKIKFPWGGAIILPGEVAYLIKHFLQNGWKPDESGTFDVGPYQAIRLTKLYEAQQRAS